MPPDSSDIMLIVKKEKRKGLQELIKENNIRDLQELFDGALVLIERYLRAIKEGRRVFEVDEKALQLFEIILDWRSPRKPTLMILKGGK